MRDMIEKVLVPLAVVLAIAGVSLAWAGSAKNAQLLTDAGQVQNELNGIQMRRMVYQRLAQDLVAYSQVQPVIDAVLVPFGFKAGPPRAAGAPQGQAPQGQPQPQTPAASPQPTR